MERILIAFVLFGISSWANATVSNLSLPDAAHQFQVAAQLQSGKEFAWDGHSPDFQNAPCSLEFNLKTDGDGPLGVLFFSSDSDLVKMFPAYSSLSTPVTNVQVQQDPSQFSLAYVIHDHDYNVPTPGYAQKTQSFEKILIHFTNQNGKLVPIEATVWDYALGIFGRPALHADTRGYTCTLDLGLAKP